MNVTALQFSLSKRGENTQTVKLFREVYNKIQTDMYGFSCLSVTKTDLIIFVESQTIIYLLFS